MILLTQKELTRHYICKSSNSPFLSTSPEAPVSLLIILYFTSFFPLAQLLFSILIITLELLTHYLFVVFFTNSLQLPTIQL